MTLMIKPKPKAVKGEAKSKFGRPGLLALARNRVGGDWAAALLLYRLMWRWRHDKKLRRDGRDWIAMSRSDWAHEAGLTEGEMKNRALPILRKQPFVVIRQMNLRGRKALWMSYDPEQAESCTDLPSHDAMLSGKGVGYSKQHYPYQSS